MPGAKLLVVEDDKTLLEVLKYNLGKDGYGVVTASDGRQAVEKARSEKPDLILLDVMLPEMSGLEVCKTLRKEMTVPIIMLTARSEEIDKIVGLEVGADDYITKPFSVRELMARVKAALRRTDMLREEAAQTKVETAPILKIDAIEIDQSRHLVSVAERPVVLNPKEFDLLVFLMKNRGQVFSREVLLEKVWGYDYAGDTRTVDVHIRWLREKIESDPESPRYLLTIRRFGYKFGE